MTRTQSPQGGAKPPQYESRPPKKKKSFKRQMRGRYRTVGVLFLYAALGLGVFLLKLLEGEGATLEDAQSYMEDVIFLSILIGGPAIAIIWWRKRRLK